MTPLNYFGQQYSLQNQSNYNLTATATPMGSAATGIGNDVQAIAKSTDDANIALATDKQTGSFAYAYDGVLGKMAQSFAGSSIQNSTPSYDSNSGFQFPLASTVPIQNNYSQGLNQLQQDFPPVVGNNNNSFQPQQLIQMFQQIQQFMNFMMQMLQQMMGGMFGGNNFAYSNPNNSGYGINNSGNYYPNNSNNYNSPSGYYSPQSNNSSQGSCNPTGSANSYAYSSPQGSAAIANSSSGTGSASATASASNSGASASAMSNYDNNSDYSSNGGTCNPLDCGRVTSGFGMRVHPISGKTKFHKGIDIAAPTGTPIKATQDGYVEFAGEANGYGNRVVVNHGNGVKTTYSHCNSINVKAGQRVGSGQKIATVGSTGRSTGSHLHYEKIINGKHVNPL